MWDDPQLVCLHGLMMSPAMWDPMERPRLALWQPGHGPEPALPPGATIETWADWLFAKLDDNGVRSAVLAGHSMGGMVALEAARRRPERVAGLILVGTQARPWTAEARAGALAGAAAIAAGISPPLMDAMARALFAPGFVARETAWIEAWQADVARYNASGMAQLLQILADRPDPTPAVKARPIPIAVIHGAQDPAIGVSIAQAMAQDFAAPIAINPDAGHCPPVETPAWFAEAFARIFPA